MSWSAPERVEPGDAPPERELLEQFLDYHRATLLQKCAGLTPEQLAARSVPPSSLSLLGLVRHCTGVEQHWWSRVVAGREAPPLFWANENPDGDFDEAGPGTADEDLERYLAEVGTAREIAAAHGLDDLSAAEDHGRRVSVRWVYVHLVEEYARHNGHADLLRECIDGSTGE